MEAACAGSEKAAKKKRAHLKQKKNRKPDEEKAAHAGSKEEEKMRKKKALQDQDPVPRAASRPSAGTEEEGSESNKPRAGKKRKKVAMRLDKEYVEYLAEDESLPPPFEPFPILYPGSVEFQERLSAMLRAEREQRDKILKQYEELGYAELEIEVPVTDDDGVQSARRAVRD